MDATVAQGAPSQRCESVGGLRGVGSLEECCWGDICQFGGSVLVIGTLCALNGLVLKRVALRRLVLKVAFSSHGTSLDSELDVRFGRASMFLVYDTKSGALEVVDNQASLQSAHGAGTLASEVLANLGVEAVVTGHCGPKAYRVLEAAGVLVYNTDLKTVKEALEALLAGTLEAASGANRESGW